MFYAQQDGTVKRATCSFTYSHVPKACSTQLRCQHAPTCRAVTECNPHEGWAVLRTLNKQGALVRALLLPVERLRLAPALLLDGGALNRPPCSMSVLFSIRAAKGREAKKRFMWVNRPCGQQQADTATHVQGDKGAVLLARWCCAAQQLPTTSDLVSNAQLTIPSCRRG